MIQIYRRYYFLIYHFKIYCINLGGLDFYQYSLKNLFRDYLPFIGLIITHLYLVINPFSFEQRLFTNFILIFK